MRFNSVSVFKWISAVLVIAVMIPAIGCGKKESQEPTPIPTIITTPTPTPAGPTGETGTLSGLQGDVQVQRVWASEWIAATSSMKIGTGDSLKTGGDGYVLITFFDGSVMEVDADSEISVEELSKASGGATTVRISQVLGNTINRVENLVDSSSNYEVETLAGSAVVRGTVFVTGVKQFSDIQQVCIDTYSENDSKSHSVSFTGSGVTVNVTEGMTSCCWEGGTPSEPFFSNPTDDTSIFDDNGGSSDSSGCACGQ